MLNGIILREINRIKAYLEGFLDRLAYEGVYEIDKPKVYTCAVGRDDNVDKGGIYMTLLHIEEETSMKQQMPVSTRSYSLDNPDMMVNLYLMFSAQDSSYDMALQNISWVLQAFQSSTVIPGDEENVEVTKVEHLSLKNGVASQSSKNDVAEDEETDIASTKVPEMASLMKVTEKKEALRMSLHQMTLEQMTNLWQSLGAKMMPAVVYKVRMMTVKSTRVLPVYPILKKGISTRIEQALPEEIAAVRLIEEEEKKQAMAEKEEAEKAKYSK